MSDRGAFITGSSFLIDGGATADSWFSYLVVEIPAEGGITEWRESVTDDDYNQ